MNYITTIVFKDTCVKQNIFDVLSGKLEFTMVLPNINFNIDISDYFSYFFKTPQIGKPISLLSNFYLDKMLDKLSLPLYKTQHMISLEEYCFIPQSYVNCLPFSDTFVLLMSNKIFRIILLSTVVYLMQRVSTILCSGDMNKLFTIFFNLVYKIEEYSMEKKKQVSIHYSVFFNVYNHIVSMTHWIYKHIYGFSYRKLYYQILFFLYNNVKVLIGKVSFKSRLGTKKLTRFKVIGYASYSLKVMTYSNVNLNIVYAILTVLYVILGWILDYLSFTWLLLSESISFNNVFHLIFWIKRCFYAVLYILWLYVGVISTNGVYFSILDSIGSVKAINIIITLLGFFISYIGSNLWYFYGQGIIPQYFRDCIIFPLLLNSVYGVNRSSFFSEIRSALLHYAFSPTSFNVFSALFRSFLEWISFTGIVFSTYGSWNLYVLYVFPHLSVVHNLVIWMAPSILSCIGIICLEEWRPRVGHFLYGFVYFIFWTSMCFFTNVIVVGYFNASNAIRGLCYFIPLNFILAFVYPVPLYRGTVRLTIIVRLLHVLFFILLLSTTLICAGLIWYIIGTV